MQSFPSSEATVPILTVVTAIKHLLDITDRENYETTALWKIAGIPIWYLWCSRLVRISSKVRMERMVCYGIWGMALTQRSLPYELKVDYHDRVQYADVSGN